MDFNYSINDVEKCILDTEDKLRNLVSSIMTQEYGNEWESNPNIGFSNSKKKTLEWRKKQQETNNPNINLPKDLISYCYPLDLREVVHKNKSLFEEIFILWEQSMALIEILNNLRNLVMHTRNVISNSQKYLVLGVCGEFLNTIYSWEHGLKRKILEYSCDLMFEEREDDSNAAETKSIELAKNWESKIQTLGNVMPSEDIPGRGPAYTLQLQEGDAQLTSIKTSRQYYGFYTQAARIHIRTQNYNVLDKILKTGNHPYWVIEWIISNSLDVHSVIDKIDKLLGKQPSSKGGSGSGDNIHWGSADYTIFNDSDRSVRVTLQELNDTSAKVSLISSFNVPNRGFVKAHEIFTPDKIMSILYAQTNIPEVRELLDQAYVN